MKAFILHTLFRLLLLLVPLTVAASAPAGADATISSGKLSAIIPIQLSPGDHILVPIRINGEGPFLFMLDTGAERNVIDAGFEKAIGLKTKGNFRVRGSGPQQTHATQTENATILIGNASPSDITGNASLSGQKFAVLDFSKFDEALGIQGLLGANVFKDFVVKIDYTGKTLRLILPGAFDYKGSGVVLPLGFSKSNCPRIDGKIEGIAATFDLDTGSDTGLELYSPFVEKNDLRQKFGTHLPTETSLGVGGEYLEQATSPLHLQLGPLKMTGPADISEDQSRQVGVKDAAGRIGEAIFSKMTVTFDYSRKRIIFEPPSGTTGASPK